MAATAIINTTGPKRGTEHRSARGRATYNEVISDHVMLIAAGVTVYMLLALVPALTTLVVVEGWREHRRDCGLVIDIATGEAVARGRCRTRRGRGT